MSKTYLAVPILNKKFKKLGGLNWPLDTDVRLGQIDDSDLGTILRDGSDRIKLLTDASQTVIYCELNGKNASEMLRPVAETARFTINVFRESEPVIVGFGIEFSGTKPSKIVAVHNLSSPIDIFTPRNSTFKFQLSAKADTVVAHFKTARRAIAALPSSLISLERFNSALLRQTDHDKIIDLAIALESLIPGSDEISFRFSLFNSLFGEPDDSKRADAYKLLRTL